MKIIAVLIVLHSTVQIAPAVDWIYPDKITYEWAVKESQRKISCDFNDTSLREILDYMGSTMNARVPLKHDFSDEVLNQKVSWKFKDIVWIDFVAKIADLTNSDIKIEKRIVRLIQNKDSEQAGTGQPATRPESKSEGDEKPQPASEGRSR